MNTGDRHNQEKRTQEGLERKETKKHMKKERNTEKQQQREAGQQHSMGSERNFDLAIWYAIYRII